MCRLASKLRTAKVSREQHLQKQEKAIINEATREYEDLFAEKLEKDRCAAVQAEERKQWDRRIDNFKAREMLEARAVYRGIHVVLMRPHFSPVTYRMFLSGIT